MLLLWDMTWPKDLNYIWHVFKCCIEFEFCTLEYNKPHILTSASVFWTFFDMIIFTGTWPGVWIRSWNQPSWHSLTPQLRLMWKKKVSLSSKIIIDHLKTYKDIECQPYAQINVSKNEKYHLIIHKKRQDLQIAEKFVTNCGSSI